MLVRRFPKSAMALAVVSLVAASGRAESAEEAIAPSLVAAPTPIVTSPPAAPTQLRHHDVQYSGIVVEYVPEQSISLRVDGGEIKRFPWSEVQQITGFDPARAPATVRPLALPQQVITPEDAADLRRSQRKKTVEREHLGLFVSGGITAAAGVGFLIGGLTLAFNREPNRESHAVLGALGSGITGLGVSQLVLGAIFLGVGGYRQVHDKDPIEPE